MGCWKNGICYDQHILLTKLLVFASFFTPRPNLPAMLGISWFPTFSSQPLMRKMTSLEGRLILEGVVGLHKTNFSFFCISGWGIDLDVIHNYLFNQALLIFFNLFFLESSYCLFFFVFYFSFILLYNTVWFKTFMLNEYYCRILS